MKVYNLITAATTVSTGASFGAYALSDDFAVHPSITAQGVVTGTGAVTATVEIEGSLDNTNWFPISTLSLTGTTTDTKHSVDTVNAAFIRADLTAITGTAATVDVYLAL